MTGFFEHLPLLYVGLALLASILAFARRWSRPAGAPSDVWRKYPSYIAFAAAFSVAVWLPAAWHVLGPLVALIGFFCSRELNRGLGLGSVTATLLASLTAALIISAEFWQPATMIRASLLLVIAATVAGSVLGPRADLARRMLGIAASLVLFPACLASIIWLRQTQTGDFSAIFLYLCIASNDAFAQIIGQLLGRRLLAPAISPGKTVEGVIGGLMLAAGVGAILFAMVGRPAGYGALLGAVIACAGLLGDLSESSWKRALGLKDFGQMLGAHGGVLDRFDSLVFAAPVALLLLGR